MNLLYMKPILEAFLLICLALLPQADFAQSARKLFKEAQVLFAEGKYQQCSEHCTQIIHLLPDNDDAFYLRARSEKELGKYQEAIEDYKAALLKSPKNERMLVELAETYQLSGELKEAIQTWERLLALNGKSLPAYYGKSLCLMNLKAYEQAYKLAEQCLSTFKDEERCAFIMGLAADSIGNLALAESGYAKALSLAVNNKEYKRNPLLLKNFFGSLASVKTKLLKHDQALKLYNEAIRVAPDDFGLLNRRAAVRIETADFVNATNDLNSSISLQPKNPEAFYLRGIVNQKLGQYAAAISDLNQAILLNSKHGLAIAAKAGCEQSSGMFNEAVRDYQLALALRPNDSELKKSLLEARTRQYEANVEAVKPEAFIMKPAGVKQELIIRADADSIEMEVQINDASGIKSFIAGGKSISVDEEVKNPLIRFSFNPTGRDSLQIRVTDIYLNTRILSWKIIRTETDAPKVRLTRPLQSLEGNTIYIENRPMLMVEGKVRDASLIQSIIVNESAASFPLDQKDPAFQALVAIGTKDTMTVKVTDQAGNTSVLKYKVVREDTSNSNPMGTTWVVFIENSNYKNLQRLEGPQKDVTDMKAALAGYKIDNVIHRKDMTKSQLDRFFTIDLRDQVQKNRVKSLIIWYAGHGKFLNETGYWIPVDGDTYEEFTYYNVNNLRAAIQSYTLLKHILVVSDACESGPAFYMAMRDDEIQNKACDDWNVTKFKSAQVLTSSNRELSSDNSLFTQAFANTLNNNPNNCVSIEYVAQKVLGIVKQNQKQTPKFGKIKGLDDENGTFFFVKKNY